MVRIGSDLEKKPTSSEDEDDDKDDFDTLPDVPDPRLGWDRWSARSKAASVPVLHRIAEDGSVRLRCRRLTGEYVSMLLRPPG